MRRSAITVIACLAALAAMGGRAFAAGNGMLAAVASDGRLVTINSDGSGLRTLWTPTAPISALAWSPDGNRLALIAGGKLVVWDVVNGTSRLMGGDEVVSDPTWSEDGTKIGFRRGSQGMIVSSDLETDLIVKQSDLVAETFAWAPNLSEYVRMAGTLLYWSGMPLELVVGAVGTPAWSADSTALAFVSALPQVPDPPGLYVRTPIGNQAATQFVAPMPVQSPRWAPNGQSLLYRADADWKIVPTTGGAATTVPGLTGATVADWQPCVPGVSQSCESVAPPICSSVSLSATTEADRPVDLPPIPCTDPAGRGLSMVIVKAPEHGSLVGQRYTPAPGFIGQDALTYKVSNGVGGSPEVTVKLFVVPRAAASVQPTATPTPVIIRAPFLTARATPKLDRRRTTLVKLACDQNCSFKLRLTATLKKRKKTVRGSTIKRTLAANKVLRLRLRLPSKPKGGLKTVWIIGTVRSATGESRTVKLPVRLPR